MALADAGGAVAKHLQVVGVCGGARADFICELHADAVELLEAAQEWHQCGDEQEGAERAALVDAHILTYWVRRAVRRVRHHEGRVVVDVLAPSDEACVDAEVAEHAPHEPLWQRAECVAQVVPDLVQLAVLPTGLVQQRGGHEVVVVAPIEGPEPLLRHR
ncbi:unnamed protein product [Phytophthora lilii]|uniref:Unnamed protein product n=1 Tax=Phytophthora lilii TaxID=2077276 RepID=A0A9W6XPM8_9STRA|nr:unnamed protein product [Phytophthora lilii]